MITEKSDPELFVILCEAAEFDTDHISKHGKGHITAYAEHEGQNYICYAEWDYSWGVDWEYYEWQLTNSATKECPCCGQTIK